MADNLSPLVNLDLINQIYKAINAQITERVYDPVYYSEAKLGSEGSRYKSAYLEALDVNGGATVDSLNGLTLTSESTGFKISGGTISKALTVAADVTVRGNITVDAATSISEPLTVVAATTINKPLTVGTDSTGGITLQSSGAGDATIEGPSGGTVTFTAPTSSDLGSLQIKNDSYISTVSVAHGKAISTHSSLTVGEGSNTGDVIIKPKSTYKLTITSDDTKAITATLRDGTCVITSDYAEDNTASKLVKRDTNGDIKVTSVNSVAIDVDAAANTNKISLSKGTASIAVTGAGLNVSKKLAVLAATTLGEKDTGDVTVKSASTGSTTIIGPDSGIAAFTTPVKGGSGSLEIKSSDDTAKSTIKIASGKTVDTYSNLTIGDATNSGSVTIKPTGTKATTIIGPEGTATLASGTYTTSVTLDNSDIPSTGKLLKIKNIAAKLFLAGPETGDETAPDFRSIVATDLPDDLTGSNAASADKVKTKANETADAKHYVSFIDSNNERASAESVHTDSKLTYTPKTGTLEATKLAGELAASNIAGTLGVEHGGTGINSFEAGDILYASDTSTLTVLNKGEDGQVLKLSNGNPTWGTDNAPTSFTWTGGTTAGPTGSLTGDGMTAVNFAAIPSASASASGVVTTGAQTFAGTKTFNETIKGSINGNAATVDQVKTIKTDSNASCYVSFVGGNNASATKETVYTNSKLTYNPSTGTLSATTFSGTASKLAHSLSVKDGASTPVTAINGWNGSADETLTIKGDSPVTTSAAANVITITHDKKGPTTATSGGDTTAQTPGFGGKFRVTSATVDTYGHTTAFAEHTVTIPSTAASATASGLVTAGDQTFAGVKTFSNETDSNTNRTEGAVIVKGGLSVVKDIYANAVHNAVWNDLVDCMEVPEDTPLEYGYCYSWEGTSVIKSSRSSKSCIGIHSNTAGFAMGEKKTKTIRAAVAGFVLAYVDKLYPEGTPLTWGDNGVLTKCSSLKRVLHPERIVATFYKEEREEKWHNLPVSGRHWVKIV